MKAANQQLMKSYSAYSAINLQYQCVSRGWPENEAMAYLWPG